MKKVRSLIFIVVFGLIFAYNPKEVQLASAHTNLPQRLPWIKSYAIDYMGAGTDPARVEEYKFEADHYDFIVGDQVDLSKYTTDGKGNIVPGGPHPIQVTGGEYNHLQVSTSSTSEYYDAQQWAARQSPAVNIENFFLHYSETTNACYGSTCYTFPAGSRVPYSSFPTTLKNGIPDLTSSGTNLVINPNSTDFIGWKLDFLARSIGEGTPKSYIDGYVIDVRPANQIPRVPSIGKDTAGNYIGGHITELSGTTPGAPITQYYTEAGVQWYDAWIAKLWAGFKNNSRLGAVGKVQVANTGIAADFDAAGNPTYAKLYPYVWGIERGDASYDLTYSPKNIYEMKKYGVYDISGGQGWLNRWYHYKNWGTYTPYPISSYSCPGPGGCAARHSIDNPEDPKEADPNYEDGQTELERFAEANLALYYVAKDDNVLFFPMQPDRNDAFGQVPKFQWMKAMELNVGQPKPNQGNFLTPWNQFTLSQGTDPSTGRTTSFIADEVVTLNDPDASANPYNWEVKDFNPSTPWQTGQWDGYMTNQPPYYRVHHTGHNNAGNYNYAIIETYYGTAPTPTIGNTYTLGQTTTSKYSIYSREYDNAMIYYRSTGWGANEKSLSNVIIELPKTADNPTGVYYRLRGMNSFDPQIIEMLPNRWLPKPKCPIAK